MVGLLCAAWTAGDAERLAHLLHADATILIDGGALVALDRRTAQGADAVATTLLDALAACAGVTLAVGEVNGAAGVIARAAGQVVGVVAIDVTGRTISRLWVVANPDKLAHWNVR